MKVQARIQLLIDFTNRAKYCSDRNGTGQTANLAFGQYRFAQTPAKYIDRSAARFSFELAAVAFVSYYRLGLVI